MNKVIKALLILIFIIVSCQNKERDKIKETLTNYLNALSPFDAEIKDHFPFDLYNDEIRDLFFLTPNSAVSGHNAYAILRVHPDAIDYSNIVMSIQDHGYNKIVFDERTIILPDSSDHSLINDPIIIPDLCELLGGQENDPHNSKSCFSKMYLIDSGKGNYTNSSKKLRSKPYLPEEWEHGYSRGIAIDTVEHDVIYWLMIW